ncbi:uncharacterized protein EAF02_006678 [Botrytis sinoallii]|uniref:uncharacterized protein n=1 Tax=Botrytis sinoallii TaxID=1463999 RepID=UPI00190078C6|nr:uncharacterized protein EAF02_006678 [Botrytis sinoallii]KAF7880787.1 hypothetical protein EAF02_006678 [Botrytis sinoallii]
MNQSSQKKVPRVQTAPDTSATKVAMPRTSSDHRTYTEKEVQGFVGNVLDMAVQLLAGERKREGPRDVSENNSGSDAASETVINSLQSGPAPARKKRALDTDEEIICNTPAITAESPRPTINQRLLSNTASRKKTGSRQNTRVKSQDLCAARRLQRETPLATWIEQNTTTHGKVRDWHTRAHSLQLMCSVSTRQQTPDPSVLWGPCAPADYDSHGKLLSTRVSVGLPAMNAAGQILLVDGKPMLGFLRDIAEQFPRYDEIEATAKAAVCRKNAAWYEQKFRDTNARHLSRSGTGNQNGPEAVKPTHIFPLFLLRPGLEPDTESADKFPPSPPRNTIHTTAFPGFPFSLPRATIRQSVPKLSFSEEASRTWSSDNRVRSTLVARGPLERLGQDDYMLKTTENNRFTSPAVSPNGDIEAENLVREDL